MPLPYFLLAGQVLAMLSIIPMFLYAETWHWYVTGVMYFGMMSLGISIGYHRYLSHKQLQMPNWLQIVCLFFATIMIVGPAVVWVANHREHHKFTDTHRDPHSPYYRGIFRAYFLQVLAKINFKLAKDVLRDTLCRFQTKYYKELLAIWLIILTLVDPFAIIYAWLAPAGFAKLIGSLVFTYSHRKRKSNNDLWLGLITFGEGFHKTHHQKPKLDLLHPLDISGWIIRAVKHATAQKV